MTYATLPSRLLTDLHSSRAADLAKIEVHDAPDAFLADWRELENIAPCSAYQTQDFTLAWLSTLGKSQGIEPFFIVIRDAENRVCALLCFGIEKRRAMRRAVFLGGKEANFNLGLFRAPDKFSRSDIETILRTAAKALGCKAPDAFVLLNQPFSWNGANNPFAQLAHQPSPSFAYGTLLPRNAEQFLAARQSKERRKKLRKKEARLALKGELAHITNSDPETTRAILSAFFAQKIARCQAQAIDTDFSDPARQSFYEKLSMPRGDRAAPCEFHALACGSQITAVFGGMAHRNCFSGMVISFDADEEIAKSSPGELLLMRSIGAQCEKAVQSFDLGIGEADYKMTYCDTPIALFDVVFPVSFKGRLYAISESLRLHLKRIIKKKQRLKLYATLKRLQHALHRNPAR